MSLGLTPAAKTLDAITTALDKFNWSSNKTSYIVSSYIEYSSGTTYSFDKNSFYIFVLTGYNGSLSTNRYNDTKSKIDLMLGCTEFINVGGGRVVVVLIGKPNVTSMSFYTTTYGVKITGKLSLIK